MLCYNAVFGQITNKCEDWEGYSCASLPPRVRSQYFRGVFSSNPILPKAEYTHGFAVQKRIKGAIDSFMIEKCSIYINELEQQLFSHHLDTHMKL